MTPQPKEPRAYRVTSPIGVRKFKREVDATDYAIKILMQAGIRSDISKVNGETK